MIGSMIIIANDTRSRRNWMNSLVSIAKVRRRKPDRPEGMTT
jgi:hypothetical protein